MMKAEQRQIVWMELYLAVVKCCEEDHLGSVTRIYNTSGTAVFSAQYDPWGTRQTQQFNQKYGLSINKGVYNPTLGQYW